MHLTILTLLLLPHLAGVRGFGKTYSKQKVKKPSVPMSPLEAVLAGKEGHFKYEIMQELHGGYVTIGTDALDGTNGENPTKTIQAKPFLIDKYPVTVQAFRKFLQTKKKFVPRTQLVGYSHVFKYLASSAYRKERQYLDENNKHMIKITGASWRMPEGPGESKPVLERLLEPVVHVSYHDALAFCMWKKKRLPTELEWEFAARGKLIEKNFPWGDTYQQNRSNLWDGPYPKKNLLLDGYKGLAPVDAYPAQNKYDMYDMIGNVWEWTASVYREPGKTRENSPLRYVIKGASFVDSPTGHANHIARISARRSFNPNTTVHNLGFRCALSKEAADNLGVRRIPQKVEL